MNPDDPSPLRNVTGGVGCGCGCLGLLVLGAATLALLGIPLEMYPDGAGNIPIIGIGGVATGLLVSLLGGTAWLASLFMD
jgi:hypothetical protein